MFVCVKDRTGQDRTVPPYSIHSSKDRGIGFSSSSFTLLRAAESNSDRVVGRSSFDIKNGAAAAAAARGAAV